MQRSVLNHFNDSISNQQRLEIEKEKQRMALLMAEDEEGYRALIDKEKNKRLAYLLDQTDKYMQELMDDISNHQQLETNAEKKLEDDAAAAAKAKVAATKVFLT